MKISGFTLIEMLVAISILSIIAGISVSAYPKFSAQLSATSESYRILSFMKETQAYGTGSYTQPGKRTAYALDIKKGDNVEESIVQRLKIENPEGSTNAYYKEALVIDALEDQKYPNEKYFVSAICTEIDCNPASSQISRAFAIYRRPNPEARLITLEGGTESIIYPDNNTGTHSKLVIFIENKIKNYAKKKIVILSTGQMYVQE